MLGAAHQASQDFDAWVLKLGTVGFTLVLGVAALVETDRFTNLVWSGILFAASLVTGLLSLRVSADGLRELAEHPERDATDVWRFKAVMIFNWVAFLMLSAAFVMLAVFVGVDAIQIPDGG